LPSWLALDKKPTVFKYIENPSEAAQIIYVFTNGNRIRNIYASGIRPSEKVQAIAVKDNPNCLKYIKEPSEKIQLLAVRANYALIRKIKNPSDKVVRASKMAKKELSLIAGNPKVLKILRRELKKHGIIDKNTKVRSVFSIMNEFINKNLLL